MKSDAGMHIALSVDRFRASSSETWSIPNLLHVVLMVQLSSLSLVGWSRVNTFSRLCSLSRSSEISAYCQGLEYSWVFQRQQLA